MLAGVYSSHTAWIWSSPSRSSESDSFGNDDGTGNSVLIRILKLVAREVHQKTHTRVSVSPFGQKTKLNGNRAVVVSRTLWQQWVVTETSVLINCPVISRRASKSSTPRPPPPPGAAARILHSRACGQIQSGLCGDGSSS